MAPIEDQSAALALHNKARREANGARRVDLTWDTSLALDAEAYTLQIAMTGKFEHSKRRRQSKNLYWCSDPSAFLRATESWLEEKPFYNGEAIPKQDADDQAEDMKRFKKHGHYTQMIWPEVTRVGMGFFCCPDDGEWGKGRCYIVARYDRPHIGGQTAWRPSVNNLFGVQRQTDHGNSTWNEEE